MISTSLTNQALDLEDLEKRSKVDVMLEKCFAISSNDASYRPKINIHKKRCNAKNMKKKNLTGSSYRLESMKSPTEKVKVTL